MDDTTALAGTHRHGTPCLWGWCLLALAGCAAPSPPVNAASPPAAPVQGTTPTDAMAASITRIALERDCFGCAEGSVLVLQRDGNASYSTVGKARHGTQDATLRGTVRPEDFDRLARMAAAQGYFALADSYEAADTPDGAWATTAIARSGAEKRVLRRGEAGPPGLRALEAAIDAARQKIAFKP